VDPGWVKNQDPIRIRHEHPGSYFRELRNNFWVTIFDADQGSGMKKIVSGMEKNSDPGYGINIPGPQQ
jgi:hypothetical protein